MGSAININDGRLYKHKITFVADTWNGYVTILLPTSEPLELGTNIDRIMGTHVQYHPIEAYLHTSWIELVAYAFSVGNNQLGIMLWKLNDKTKLILTTTSITDEVTLV